MGAQRILVVDDEVEIASYLRRGLVFAGYSVEVAHDGFKALERLREHPADLVVLDLMLPGLDGLEVARRIRAAGPTPIIMLTARDAVDDRVEGLMAGADDYMVKPFAFKELEARIAVQLRRQQTQSHGELLRVGPLALDVAARDVRVGERVVQLTAKEWDLLELFARHAGQVLNRSQIYEQVWGYDFGSDSNVIEVYVRGLRQKLEAGGEARLLHTLRGVGYVLRRES